MKLDHSQIMNYPRPKLWKGNDLKGTWEVTLKIDGVRMLRDTDGFPISRNLKPLYNLENVPDHIKDAEIYVGNWEDTISLVRTKEPVELDLDWVYPLYPEIDDRLFEDIITNPTKDYITFVLKSAIKRGYEGLVLRSGDKHLKVKPNETYDVVVDGIIPGEGRHKGRMGALTTPMGKVGTGFTDKQREEFIDIPFGSVIEVACMSLTPAGKFRHPRFVRLREDK